MGAFKRISSHSHSHKRDKLKKNEIPKAIKLIRETLQMEDEDILIPFSAETKVGREEIYKLIEELRGPGMTAQLRLSFGSSDKLRRTEARNEG